LLSAFSAQLAAEWNVGGSMGEFSPLHWLLVIGIALLLFGTGKFTAVGKGLGEGIRNFKASMKETDEEKKKEEEKKAEPPSSS
jgi:sec-independent protein translocase protein TatA